MPFTSTPFPPHLLPGARGPDQRHHTLTLHTPDFTILSSLRRQLRARLESWDIGAEYRGMAEFAVSEALTNLIKHPVKKADTVQVTLTHDGHILHIAISDDATPFASFTAKCAEAGTRAAAADSLAEGGYGLACLLKMSPGLRYTTGPESRDGRNYLHMQIDAPTETSAPPEASDTAPAATGQKPLIYLIDHNPTTLALHRQMLEGAYHVRAFEYAADALAAFTDAPPALIISEISLPDMDGAHLRQQLSQLEKGNETPFIFLTSQSAWSHEHDINLVGIDDFLSKPISPQRLLNIVARLLRRSAQIASAVHGSFDRKISRMLHPALPRQSHGWKIAMRNSQAEAGGGDFILHQPHEECFFAVVADVMGHSHDSKFFACAYAGYVRSFMQAIGRDSDPAHFMAQLSAAVHADSFFDLTHMTCLSFQLFKAGRIRLATAGHPAPSLCTGDGGVATARALDISGPLAGLTAHNSYLNHDLRLRPGDRLLVATDGYWNFEGRREALHSVLESVSHLDIERAADRLWQAHIDFTAAGTRHMDDTTLVILEAGDDQ